MSGMLSEIKLNLTFVLMTLMLSLLSSCNSEIEVDQGGDSNSLNTDLFFVKDGPESLNFEDEISLDIGLKVTLYSIGVTTERNYSNTAVEWSLIGNIGELTVGSGGRTAQFTASNLGTGYVKIKKDGLEKDIKLNVTGDSAPVSLSLNPQSGYREIEKIVTLSYSDTDSDLATNCSLSNLVNISESTSCACSSGICSVGVTGDAGYTGGVAFDYTVTANGAISNTASVNFILNDLGASKVDQWVRVPANSGGLGLNEFFVMKYEAKAWNDVNANSIVDSGELDLDGVGVSAASFVPVSVAGSQPWRSINANDSAAECESLNSETASLDRQNDTNDDGTYALISNSEWMAIVRDIEAVDNNWTGGSVGAGCLYRGNSGDTTCGYNSPTDPDSGTGRDTRAKYLTSIGQEIFDIAGNVWEWTDWDASNMGFQLGPTTCAASWLELPSVSCGDLASADYDTISGTLTSSHGVGQLYGDSGGAALRGGRWDDSTIAGAFSLSLYFAPTFSFTSIGFRCVYRP